MSCPEVRAARGQGAGGTALLRWRVAECGLCLRQSMVSRVSAMDVEEGYGAVAAVEKPSGELHVACVWRCEGCPLAIIPARRRGPAPAARLAAFLTTAGR